MDKPESFEQTEYGDEGDIYEKYQTLRQIMEDYKRTSPVNACSLKLEGDKMRLFFHCSEMFLPSRIKIVQELAHDTFAEMLKHLKKEYKSRTKKVIKLKELKDLANYTVEKTSLNERYYAVFWRVYEID